MEFFLENYNFIGLNKTLKRKIIALFYGFVCHLTFAFAILSMAYSLYYGLSKSIFSSLGFNLFSANSFFNILLIFQFPILHSFLLSKKGSKVLEFFSPREYAKELRSTLFAIISSIQLILVFNFWQSSNHLLFLPSGIIFDAFIFTYALSWILLAKSMADAGLSLQTGLLGWYALYKGQPPSYPKFKVRGLNKYCRQPMYLSFSLILISAPYFTLDRLFFVLLWCTYCYLAPRLKEKRAVLNYGKQFRDYQEKIPYFLPKINKKIL